MKPEGYVRTACDIAIASGLLVEVMEYALGAICEFTDDFEALNYALKNYNLETIPELPNPPAIHRILIKREDNWEEPFRIEYDGKYITLFGRDKNYVVPDYRGHGQIEYEEMVLVPVVEEIRNIIPQSAECDAHSILIKYIMKVDE
jgi:hypothetical protein